MTDIDTDKLVERLRRAQMPNGRAMSSGEMLITMQVAATAILAMAEENKRLRADAERYRWLRDHSCPPHNFYIAVPDEFSGVHYNRCDVDTYIDDARRALGKGEEPSASS